MVTGRRADPLRGFRFKVQIEGFGEMGFQKCSGLKSETEIAEYREGDDASSTRKMPGLTGSSNVVLSRGVSPDKAVVNWYNQIYNPESSGLAGDGGTDFRKPVTITMMDKDGSVVKTIELLEAWPAVLSYSDLDAESSDVLIETLELANEGIKVS